MIPWNKIPHDKLHPLAEIAKEAAEEMTADRYDLDEAVGFWDVGEVWHDDTGPLGAKRVQLTVRFAYFFDEHGAAITRVPKQKLHEL